MIIPRRKAGKCHLMPAPGINGPSRQESQTMGEIKSTLDLVMERTRHLTLSSEEKSAQNDREQLRRIQGLIQKYRDQVITLAEMEKKLARDYPAELHGDSGMLHSELLRQIQLGRDNGATLVLLETVCKADTAALAALLAEYDQSLAGARDQQAARRLADLAARQGIAGSALIPNLDTDPEWQKAREELAQRFDRRLTQIKGI